MPDPDSSDPAATGTGRASYGFNAKPDKNAQCVAGLCGIAASGHFNYVNHVTGLHVNGPVDHISRNADGSITFCGACGPATKPANCQFTVTVLDNGEPGVNDKFGLVVTGDLTENRSFRTVARGNIQFHKP